MGIIQKIFYYHVSSAWNAFLAFLIVAISSIIYLKTKENKWDIYALSSAEIGVIFSAITLITGSMWAKGSWNTWWTWDPRLTTALVMWLIYASYLTLRKSLKTEKKARLSAVFGIIAFTSVPITYLSIRIWPTIHPNLEFSLMLPAKMTLILSITAFTLLYIYLFHLRTKIEKTKEKIKKLKTTK
ncbi:MAG: ABC-type transport system involved in cytochrome c biogenesis permease component [Candidatus Methanohalarchaeum thermophilum]|uniref:ABC-type transport system involved in cytochrome c biogenesis permease component n=1 Tax=Methanohalarchaeum thermophilum TaxID=1903181 RepID=A0A1Q6DS95_METT1|nr:MAG: ABC-type transport system involved in cytochrome c biogenesis permease component [Candidatus Methanohalarchaeum thermophilum]